MMDAGRIGGLTLLLVSLGIGAPASAQDMGRTGSWVIEPLTTEATVSSQAHPVLQARILPLRLAIPSVDYKDAVGTVLVTKGAQLVWVPAMGGLKNDHDMYCAPRQLKNSTSPIWRNDIVSNQLVCFIDGDKDGRFERYQNCYSMYPNVLIDGKCRGDAVELRDAPYDSVDRGQFRSDMRLQLAFVSKFQATQCVGNEHHCLPLDGRLSFNGVPAGTRLSWLGSDLIVKSVSEGGVEVAVEKIAEPRVLNVGAPWALFKVWF